MSARCELTVLADNVGDLLVNCRWTIGQLLVKHRWCIVVVVFVLSPWYGNVFQVRSHIFIVIENKITKSPYKILFTVIWHWSELGIQLQHRSETWFWCNGQVINRVGNITEFRHKWAKGFGKWAALPHPIFLEVRPGPLFTVKTCLRWLKYLSYKNKQIMFYTMFQWLHVIIFKWRENKIDKCLEALMWMFFFEFAVIIIGFVCKNWGLVTKLNENGECSFPKERENLSCYNCFSIKLS